jgi:hypothetical protein
MAPGLLFVRARIIAIGLGKVEMQADGGAGHGITAVESSTLRLP